MRIKFEIDSDNNVTILNADQDNSTIIVKQDGDKKIVLVSTVEISTTNDLYSITGEIS